MNALLALADPLLRAELAAVVTAAGHDVVAVADGGAAVAHFDRARPPLVIVADRLAGIDGVDVVRHIRAAADHDAFVLAVIDESDGRLDALLEAGADDFILTVARVGDLPGRLAARTAIAASRIAADAARRRAEAALADAQRLAGIGEMSLALQHEINNPLAVLLGHAALLEQGLHDPGEERALLAVIVEQAHRIADVVKRISALRHPTSVEVVRGGRRMLDISSPDTD